MSDAPVRRSGGPGLYTIVTLICAAVIIFLLVYPLGRMILQVIIGGQFGQALSVLSQPWFGPVFLNTAIIVGSSTLFAVIIGALLAWINERTDAQLGPMGSLMPIIPLLIPNVAMAIGWVFIAAPRVGFLNGWLRHLPDWMSFEVGIYSWGGMIFIYTINAVPYVYLIVAAALRNLDPALEEASRINGAGLFRTFRQISAPAVRPALLSSALLCVITSIGVYSIPAVIGTTAKIDVLTTRIVYLLNREFPPKMAEAQVLGIVMLILVGLLWYFQTRSNSGGQFATVGGRATGGGRIEMGKWKWPARLVTLAYLAATSVFPILALGLDARGTLRQDHGVRGGKVGRKRFSVGHMAMESYPPPCARPKSSACRRRPPGLLRHAPVDAFQQVAELRRRDRDDAVGQRWPQEASTLSSISMMPLLRRRRPGDADGAGASTAGDTTAGTISTGTNCDETASTRSHSPLRHRKSWLT